MTRSDAAIVATWTRHLASYTALAAAAKVRHTKAQAALMLARKKDAHPRAALVAARDKASADLDLRRGEMAHARKVIARHSHRVPAGVSAAGVALVARFEGFRANAYRDAVGVLTQGYGETQGVTPGHAWTEKYALDRLKTRLNRDYCPPVLNACRAAGFHPTQNEVDAMTSLSYNLGGGVFSAGHTIGDAIRTKDPKRIANAFMVYNKAGGSVLAGLTSRRAAERTLFLK